MYVGFVVVTSLSVRVCGGGVQRPLMKPFRSSPMRVDWTCLRHTGKFVAVSLIGK